MANQSFDAFSHHLQGLGALLKKQGVSNLRSSTSRRIFYEYRALAVRLSTTRCELDQMLTFHLDNNKPHDSPFIFLESTRMDQSSLEILQRNPPKSSPQLN